MFGISWDATCYHLWLAWSLKYVHLPIGSSDNGLLSNRWQAIICSNIGMLYWCMYASLGLDLTHWGQVTHICVSKLTIIGSDNGLSPGRRQAIIWTNAGILLIRPLGTNFNEMWIKILTFIIHENAFEGVVCEMASILFQPQWVNVHYAPLNIHTILIWFTSVLGISYYRQFSNIRRNQSQNINVSSLALLLSLPNPLKPCVKLRMKM